MTLGTIASINLSGWLLDGQVPWHLSTCQVVVDHVLHVRSHIGHLMLRPTETAWPPDGSLHWDSLFE